MKQTQKNILTIAGVIGTVIGIVGFMPSFIQEKYLAATAFTILIVFGLILLSIAFGD